MQPTTCQRRMLAEGTKENLAVHSFREVVAMWTLIKLLQSHSRLLYAHFTRRVCMDRTTGSITLARQL